VGEEEDKLAADRCEFPIVKGRDLTRTGELAHDDLAAGDVEIADEALR
jgi:hypothetical protein